MKNKLEKITGFDLEPTGNLDFGDYSANIALVKAKSEGKNPVAYAQQLADKLNANGELSEFIQKIEVVSPGFINFWLKTDVLVSNLIQISKEKEKYGKSDSLRGKKIMFEYAHPNTHKAFHIGHLRNITTGESLSRIYTFIGATVIRANYQGDIGLHIAKAIYGIQISGFEDPGEVKARAKYLGEVYAKGATAYEESDEAKVKVGEINKKIYDKSDPEINKLYEETRKWSLEYFDTIYERVYTKFDRFYFESETADLGKEIALDALRKGILKESEGAVIFPGSEYGLHDRVFVSGKGVPTYEAKDLGLAKLQFSEYKPDQLIHTVGPEQIGYFQVVFKALELIQPETKGREIHIPYGWVRLKEGKMSSRTGNVILGEQILDDAKKSIIDSYKSDIDIAEMIAVAAVKYSFLKVGLNQDIAFDLKESISLEGNSGPYLQYTIARANSVITKSSGLPEVLSMDELLQKNSKNAGFNAEELTILRTLVRFSGVIEVAAKSYSPNLLCNYLYDLAQKFNSFYNSQKIIGSDNETFRLVLTQGTYQVLKNGLKLLGINSPDKM